MCPIKWMRRKEARPAEIVEAAITLFVEKGFAATKMEDIARRAGVTKGTPYLYFSNKEELFKAAVRSSLVLHLDEGEQFIEQFQGSSMDLLRESMMFWWRAVGESHLSGIPKLMLAEAGNFPDLAGFYAEEVILRANALLARILRRGIERGEFRPVDVDAMVGVLAAPLLKAQLWKHSFGCCTSQLDMERFFAAVFDLIGHGLQQPAPLAAGDDKSN